MYLVLKLLQIFGKSLSSGSGVARGRKRVLELRRFLTVFKLITEKR